MGKTEWWRAGQPPGRHRHLVRARWAAAPSWTTAWSRAWWSPLPWAAASCWPRPSSTRPATPTSPPPPAPSATTRPATTWPCRAPGLPPLDLGDRLHQHRLDLRRRHRRGRLLAPLRDRPGEVPRCLRPRPTRSTRASGGASWATWSSRPWTSSWAVSGPTRSTAPRATSTRTASRSTPCSSPCRRGTSRSWPGCRSGRCLPRGLDGILVTGLGVSAHRDAMPVIRMQADVQNQGYACGHAAAMVAKSTATIRNVDLKAPAATPGRSGRAAQRRSARKGLVPASQGEGRRGGGRSAQARGRRRPRAHGSGRNRHGTVDRLRALGRGPAAAGARPMPRRPGPTSWPTPWCWG